MSIRASRPHNPTPRQTSIFYINVYKKTGKLPTFLSKCKLCNGKATELVNTAKKPNIILRAYCKTCLNKNYTLGQIKNMKV